MKIHVCSAICPRTLSVPRSEQFSENVARGKPSPDEKIMAADKYPSILSRQIQASVNDFCNTQFWKMGNATQIFPSFSWDYSVL